jgi:hypothetical protein
LRTLLLSSVALGGRRLSWHAQWRSIHEYNNQVLQHDTMRKLWSFVFILACMYIIFSAQKGAEKKED